MLHRPRKHDIQDSAMANRIWKRRFRVNAVRTKAAVSQNVNDWRERSLRARLRAPRRCNFTELVRERPRELTQLRALDQRYPLRNDFRLARSHYCYCRAVAQI